MINELKPNQVFIFGSNVLGKHGGGAARQAFDDFGAEWGVGEGMTGQCYALPTLDENHQQVSEQFLKEAIMRFYNTAITNQNKQFLLTKVGCGIAGFDEEYIKSLFTVPPANIVLPEGW